MKDSGSIMETLVGQVTSKETMEVSSALPFAVATNFTSKIPISDVSKIIFLHTSKEGQPVIVTLELVHDAW